MGWLLKSHMGVYESKNKKKGKRPKFWEAQRLFTIQYGQLLRVHHGLALWSMGFILVMIMW